MKKRARRGAKGKPQGLKPQSSCGPHAARLKSSPDTKPTNGRSDSAASQFVQIEKPVYGGAFLARVEGKAVFVPLALPGEQARVRVIDDKHGYATAEVEAIVAAAAERVTPACKYFGACGGCQYQHAEYTAQVEMKQAILRETLERGGVRAPTEMAVLTGDPWAYRNRIRLAFDAEGRAGYRGRRSHTVIAIEECPIAAPLLVRAAMAAAELVRALPVRARPEDISLFCDARETALLASAMTAGGETRWFEKFARGLAERVHETKGLELATQGGRGREARMVARWGASSLLYRAAGFDYRVDQGEFFQANRWLLDELVECATKGLSGGLAWDLFAGVGLFARKLAERFERVVAVESAAAATAALKENLKRTNATVVKAATLEFLRGAAKGDRPDVIVADPPRTGLGAETTELLGRVGAPEMVYVSCDPATLARDLRALVAAGYAIERITLADLFPQTFHLETIVRLRR